jgi:cyanophycin synthetase
MMALTVANVAHEDTREVPRDTRPDAATEIRVTTLHATRGLNYWSRRPVIRMDLSVGAYDDISSAEVPGFADAIVQALPGLRDHECSIGTRGGFVHRLRRGTYAPHIIEHVALELQLMAGYDVSYGKTRGGDEPGEYTLVFEHGHEQMGLRAAAAALDIVQRAFNGTLDSITGVVEELQTLARSEDAPPVDARVLCGVTGGSHRAETRSLLLEKLSDLLEPGELVIDVSPAYLLQAGLPYSRSEIAIVLDTCPTDVPERYQEADRARRLMSIVADAVWRGGTVICPAKDWEVQDYAREQDCRVAVFSADDDVTRRDQRVASAVALVRDERIVIERFGATHDAGPLDATVPADAQVAAALADYLVREERAEVRDS